MEEPRSGIRPILRSSRNKNNSELIQDVFFSFTSSNIKCLNGQLLCAFWRTCTKSTLKFEPDLAIYSRPIGLQACPFYSLAHVGLLLHKKYRAYIPQP